MDLRQKLYGSATLVLPRASMQKLQARNAQADFRKAGIAFIHVPRAAGLSVLQAVYRTTTIRHFTTGEFLQVLPADLRTLPRFAITRNPWDRAVSAYHFATQGGVPGGAQIWRPERYRGSTFATFDTFVHDFLAVRNVWKLDGVFRPQMYYLDNPAALDHIGRFHRLTETAAWLSETLGREINLQESNSTPHANYRSYYSDTSTRNIVADIYRTDIEHFEFEY